MKLINFIFLIAAIILIIVGFIIGYFVFKTEKCELNPLSYGIEKIEKINNLQILCTCSADDSRFKPFYFDDLSIYDENPMINLRNLSIS